jgi:hypothetical protein
VEQSEIDAAFSEVYVLLDLDKYVVEFPRSINPDTTRYYTDETLPDEIKHKLGLLMFGSRDKSIGRCLKGANMYADHNSDVYIVRLSPETYEEVHRGTQSDTRSQSQSEG